MLNIDYWNKYVIYSDYYDRQIEEQIKREEVEKIKVNKEK